MKKKTLICNVHSDEIQNKFIKDYIIARIREDKSIKILSENVLWNELD